MGEAQPDHRGIVERRRLDTHRVCFDRVPQHEMQEPLSDRQVWLGRSHIVDPRPREEQPAHTCKHGEEGEVDQESLHGWLLSLIKATAGHQDCFFTRR
jgi:hypothetical protein